MTISAHTLMMAIKALDLHTRQLGKLADTAEDPELSELEQELHDFSKAQMELKRLYIAQQTEADNLPAYEDLLAG